MSAPADRRLRHRLIRLVAALGLIALIGGAVPAAASAGSHLSADQRATLLRYATDTWASFLAMTDEESGLPADSLQSDGTRSVQTSTTNIGAYLWSTVVAERLGIIDHAEAVARTTQTITTLESM